MFSILDTNSTEYKTINTAERVSFFLCVCVGGGGGVDLYTLLFSVKSADNEF